MNPLFPTTPFVRYGFRLAFQMERKKPKARGGGHCGRGLGGAGKTYLAGRVAARRGRGKFARRYDIRTQTKPRQCRQNSGIGIGLHRKGDQWIGKGLKRFLKHADMTFQSGSRIDVNGRADRLRNGAHWQLFAMLRSEERRVGQEGDSTCRSRWSPYH